MIVDFRSGTGTPAPPVVPRPSIGVVFPGDPDAPATWSGTPSGVIEGLRAIGAAPHALIATPSPRLHAVLRNAAAVAELPHARQNGLRETLRLSRAVARNTPAMGWVYSRAAHSAVTRAGNALAGLIQIGTGYSLPASQPIATLEDMTIRQALDVGYPEWRALTKRQIANRLDSQRRAYRAATACCFTTQWAARSAISDYGVPEEKVYIVGVGRNHAVDPPASRDWTTPRFLFVGWDWERKNGPAVLRAFERLRERYGQATLDIVGKHPLITARGVTDHGVLRLNRPDERARLEPLFKRSTCFVMPSKCEPSALAYVEGMHAGLPCIGSIVGGAGNLIGSGGCVVDPHSDDALLQAMVTYSDPETAARVGALAHARSRLFTWPAVSGRLLRALSISTENALTRGGFVDHSMSPEFCAG